MADEKEYEFHELPLKVQQKIVDSTDPDTIYNEDWFHQDYYDEYFREILEQRLGKGADGTIKFEEPSQGSIYAYIEGSMSFDLSEIIPFIETAKLGHQNGIANHTFFFSPKHLGGEMKGKAIYSMMNEDDILAYTKSKILPMLKSTEELQAKTGDNVPILQFGIEIDDDNFSTHSGDISLIDFGMEYTCDISGITTEWFEAQYGYWSNDEPPEESGDQDSPYEAIEIQVKPIYEFLENEFIPIFKKWLVEDVLDKLSDAVNADNDWQTSDEAIWQYYENNDTKTYNIEGEEV